MGFQPRSARCTPPAPSDADIIITTALIPGKPAPKLITAEMCAEHEAWQRDRGHNAEQGGNR